MVEGILSMPAAVALDLLLFRLQRFTKTGRCFGKNRGYNSTTSC